MEAYFFIYFFFLSKKRKIKAYLPFYCSFFFMFIRNKDDSF